MGELARGGREFDMISNGVMKMKRARGSKKQNEMVHKYFICWRMDWM